MNGFEYEITMHPSETFHELVFFCSEAGECRLEEVPRDQIKTLQSLLNERGAVGWELVQVSFGKDGMLAFWKRRKGDKVNQDAPSL